MREALIASDLPNFAQPETGVPAVNGLLANCDPWTEDGTTYRTMHVTWPSYLATHNPDQVLYLDHDGLIRRHDYTVEITGNTEAAHYMSDYMVVSGIKVPTRHRIYPRGADGKADPDLLIVSIDYSDVQYLPRVPG